MGQYGYSTDSYNSSAWYVYGNIPDRRQFTVGSGRWVWPSFLANRTINKDIFSPVHVLRILELFLRLNATRLALPEYTRFKSLKVEIQVRTILQHAWAEIEHDIGYKSSKVIPSPVRRRFAVLAGMLEVADREFEGIQERIPLSELTRSHR